MRVLFALAFRQSMVALLLAGAGVLTAGADMITFSAAQGDLAAAATFEDVGTDLIVTLTNTSTADVLIPAEVLTALFFDVSGGPLSLTPLSAVLGPGSVVLFGSPDPGGVVGGEWEYEDSFPAPAPHGAAYGLSSAGLGLFGAGLMFPGSNLQGPVGVDGLQFGILAAGDNPATGNAVVTGDFALIKHEVVFRLSGLPLGFDVAQIHNVNWQYGTALGDPNIPEPASLTLVLAGVLLTRFRRGRNRGSDVRSV